MTGDREQTGKVSHVTLSKAELCNNGPYLDARTDRISPHTSLLPSHTLQGWRLESTEATKFELGRLDIHGMHARVASSIFC